MDENEKIAKLTKYKATMKAAVLSIYTICITYLAVHFEDKTVLWWLLPILLF